MSIGVAISGSGFMGRTYAECLARMVSGARFTAVSGGTRAAGLGADYGVPVEQDLTSLVARGDVDALIITTPEQVHVSEVRTAADAGVHVLLEKPTAATLAECDAIIDSARDRIVLMQVKHWRFRGVFRAGRSAIDTGAIGAIQRIRVTAVQPASVPVETSKRKPFYLDPDGGGFFMGWNTHVFDTVRYLAGAEAASVTARVGTQGGHGLPNLTTLCDIEFENGVLAQLWSDVGMPVDLDPADRFRFMVVGETGVLDLAGPSYADLITAGVTKRLYEQPAFDPMNPLEPARLDGYARMVQEFVDAATEGRDPAVTAADGRASVSLCLAALESSETGRPVKPS